MSVRLEGEDDKLFEVADAGSDGGLRTASGGVAIKTRCASANG
jgi:hypothetical protein